MFGDRTPPEENRAQSETDHRLPSVLLLSGAILVAFVVMVLKRRRRAEPTLEPPF